MRHHLIVNATRFELSKALICAGLAVDALFDGLHVLHRYMFYDALSMAVVLTAAGLLGIAAGLFLTRWFAGWLSGLR